MAAQLQDAIKATRNGNTVEAQKILADILKSDTENVQAWYLLALVVDSPDKKEAYLTRVLTLDPNHVKAHEALAELEAVELPPPPIVQDMVASEVMADEMNTAVSTPIPFEEPTSFPEDDALPSWLDDQQDEPPQNVLIEEEPSEIFNADIPDWLSGEHSPADVQEEPPTLISDSPPEELETMLAEERGVETPEAKTVESDETAVLKTEPTALEIIEPSNQPSARPYNILLIVLVLFTILTVIAIIVQLIRII